MIYDKESRSCGDGEWHCPFSRSWVERMKKAAGHCRHLTARHIEATLNAEVVYFKMLKMDFMYEEQDARGLPLSWCEQEESRFVGWPDCCTSIYDYDSVPNVVITNGEDDWPLKSTRRAMMA